MSKSFSWSVLLLAAIAALTGLFAAELVVRLIRPAPPAVHWMHPEGNPPPGRLPAPGTATVTDTGELYAGGGITEFQIGLRRLVEPEPAGEARQHILFLGGSTTESSAVPPSDRWVHRLNLPGERATYNAGVSGANVLDSVIHYRYLTEVQHLNPDLVVASNSINDLTWMRRFRELGLEFSADNYDEGIERWLRLQRERDRSKNGWGAIQRLQLPALLRRALQSEPQLSVVERIQSTNRQRRSQFPGGIRPLTDCSRRRTELDQFEALAKKNLQLLRQEVQRRDAQLVVLIEATALDAPADSFKVDLRPPFSCDSHLLGHDDAQTYLRELALRYAAAARELDLPVLDALSLITAEQPADGRLFYDGIHYTPQGSLLLAGVLGPEIDRLLKAGGTQ